jgi:dihydropteroate synthase
MPACPATARRAIGRRTFDFTRQVAVMAIVNRTRDSFYDRGRTFALASALAAVDRAVAEGADWLDVGGTPFSPTAEPVGVEEEISRVVPLISAVRDRTDAVISVDTFRPEVAGAALAAGADAINDTSGLHDLAMADVAAQTGATLVVCHSRAAPLHVLPRPTYDDVVAEVRAFLACRVDAALKRGVAADRIVIDPGHDLNKNTLHSLELTRRLSEIAALGYPLLASVSNKDFIFETLGRSVDDVTDGTVAAVVMCVLQGARIVRVHDVRAAVGAVRMVEAVQGWRLPTQLRHNIESPP